MGILALCLIFWYQMKSDSQTAHVAWPVVVNDDCIIAGFSPATIICINKHNDKMVDYFLYSSDMRVCIHDLTCWIQALYPAMIRI